MIGFEKDVWEALEAQVLYGGSWTVDQMLASCNRLADALARCSAGERERVYYKLRQLAEEAIA